MSDWPKFYYDLLTSMWANMTPMQYGYMLIFIATVGWLMMKSATR